MYFSTQSLKFFIITLLSTSLAACMVGPDYHSPNSPDSQTYTGTRIAEHTVSSTVTGSAGKSQQFILGENIPAEWWTLFHSPELNRLIKQGIANSPNLNAAKAALVQAEETLNAQIASALVPSISAQMAGQRQRFSGATFGGSTPSKIFNLYNASVNVTYTLDLFGGARRGIEAQLAQVDYERYELEAAYLTLTSNIVTTAITAASLEAQIQATQQLIRSQEEQLNIMQKQLGLGGIAQTNILSQQTLLAQTRATLPPLAQSLAQAKHALSVLTGTLPNENQIPKFNLDKLTLPARLPVSVPSRLIHQRPDIQASEALLHQACAEVGVATANLFPQITLSGNYGWASQSSRHLFNANNNVWDLGSQILQPIFNAGSLQAKRRAAIAAYQEAAAQYRQTVLQAFQNVADTLRALENDAKTLRAQREAEIAAQNTARITQKQFQLGAVSYLSLLTAQQQYLQTRINRIQAQATRYADTAALFQAMGGGWWNRNKV